jgi:hypothetical protein
VLTKPTGKDFAGFQRWLQGAAKPAGGLNRQHRSISRARATEIYNAAKQQGMDVAKLLAHFRVSGLTQLSEATATEAMVKIAAGMPEWKAGTAA